MRTHTTTPRQPRETYVLTNHGPLEIHAFQVAERWEFLVLLAEEALPEGWWERAGSRAVN